MPFNSETAREAGKKSKRGPAKITWKSAKEAIQAMSFENAVIGDCCRGKYKTSCGYKWMFENDYKKRNIA